MANTNRSLIKATVTGDIVKRELGFQPRYIIVDNLSDVDAYLYDKSYAIDPIATGQPPLDVIPKRDFKIIIAPDGAKNYSLAWGAGAGANQYLGFILTDDHDYVRQFHQTNLPNLVVSGTIATTNAAASQVDGHSASIGATTDLATANTVIGRLKALIALLPAALTGGGNLKTAIVESTANVATTNAATSQVDGHSASIGATTDAEAAAGNGTLIALTKNLRTRIGNLETYLDGVEVKLDTSNTNTSPSTAPTLYAITLTNANTEYSQALPANTRRFMAQARTAADIRIAYETGKVAAPTDPYQSIKSGTVKTIDGIKAAPTLYLASGTAGTIVEIEVWV